MLRPKGGYILNSRSEFERNLHVLEESMRQGKFSMNSRMTSTSESLKRVKVAPNRRINFATVNELVRNMANMMGQKDLYEKE